MKRSLLTALLLAFAVPAFAATDAHHPKQLHWPSDGVFGSFDRQAAQRGFKVYKEVCASCHAVNHLYYRNLQALGFSEAEVKTLAAQVTVKDGPNDAGDMFDRPGRPSDPIARPFANENAARAANGGAYPPDLSLIVKARHDGMNYLYSLLTGYVAPPAEVKLAEGMHYNPYFPGGQIAMPQPIASDGQVTYDDGTAATVDQMARDVTVFLQWAAEPEMEARKEMGLKVMIFLAISAVFLFIAKRRVWSKVH